VGYSDISALAAGCAVLGVGGGGNAETGGWAARHQLGEGGQVPLLRVADLTADDLVLPLGAIGAPTISQEMIPSGQEPIRVRDAVEERLGRRVTAVMASEIGGSNGVRALGWAHLLGVPLLDADGIGRAFPEITMNAMEVRGVLPGLVVISDVQGNRSVIEPISADWGERLARASSVASGASALLSAYVMNGDVARDSVVGGSVSRALEIGTLLTSADASVDALVELLDGHLAVEGKLVELERVNSGGFVRGSAVIAGTGAFAGRMVRMGIQNENLLLMEDGLCIASTPDLIVALDSESGGALGTDELQYGQRLSLIVWPCDPIWRTEDGLRRTGPAAFGYDVEYVPIEERVQTSVH
jgi:DUF917 family protein